MRLAALLFAMDSADIFRPRCHAAIFSLVSGDGFARAAHDLAIASGDIFLPMPAADSFARVSCDGFTKEADIFASVSAVCLRPFIGEPAASEML